MTIRDMSISPCHLTSLIIPKVLGLGSKNPMKLIVPLLNKVTKSAILRCNIGSKGHLFLLNGPNGGLKVGIISGRWVGRGTTSSLRSKWG